MPLHQNNVLLITQLEAAPLVANRYANLRAVNCAVGGAAKRGCFSIVFKAHDVLEDRPVALKFFDLDPGVQADVYRRTAFVRESQLLQALLNRERCLQLVDSLNTYQLNVGGFAVPCSYFAVEWLDNDIDHYFLARQPLPPVAKLRLFNDVVLAVEALHRCEIFHRDLKADNLRSADKELRRVVVAIDLGTAARVDSGALATGYGHPVGAPAYAAPEAFCGAAGNRRIAQFTDYYALGCLLYELFNPDYFYVAVNVANPSLQARLIAVIQNVPERVNEAIQLAQLNTALDHFGLGVAPVRIDGPGSLCDAATAPILNEVLRKLTHFDYRQRAPSLAWVRTRLWSAIRVLENERLYQARLAASRARRKRRIERLRERDAKARASVRVGGAHVD